ncbi:MAG: DUF1616 domain-containing protein, partial [Chloroflexi bacterium]|nr:DUF1616 domain-containing protein [Chloroflexota bacterium]
MVLFPDSTLRAALGLPFVLFFPGYTLVCALFPGKQDLGNLERLALSLGLSLATVPLIGLALNYTPWGIRLTPIIASLFIFTLLLSIISNYRRTKLPSEQKLAFAIPIKILFRRNAMHKLDKLFIVGFLASIVIVGGLTVYLVSTPKVGDRFSEFYLTSSSGKIADYPTNLTLGENGTVTLGIINHEYQNTTYKVVITLDNETIGTISSITLSNAAAWEQNYTFTPQKTGNKLHLVFDLYKEGLDEPY